MSNELGINDMSGNVWEWCSDRYDGKYYEACKAKGKVVDPKGPGRGGSRVLRGGGLWGGALFCRLANRGGVNPDFRNGDLGFRLVFAPQEEDHPAPVS